MSGQSQDPSVDAVGTPEEAQRECLGVAAVHARHGSCFDVAVCSLVLLRLAEARLNIPKHLEGGVGARPLTLLLEHSPVWGCLWFQVLGCSIQGLEYGG